MAEEKEKEIKKEEKPKSNEQLIKELKSEFENQLKLKLEEQKKDFEKQKEEMEERHIRELKALLQSGNVLPQDEEDFKEEVEKDEYQSTIDTITKNILRRF